MDTQTFEQFKVRLAQTIFWCARRADKENPSTSLRTPELRPNLLEENRYWTVKTVASARELCGGVDLRNASLPDDLGGGRLLIYFPNSDLACGAAQQETLGFFDINNVPPWDTWVAYLQDEYNADSFDTEYLIAWVPPEFVSLANDGINVIRSSALCGFRTPRLNSQKLCKQRISCSDGDAAAMKEINRTIIPIQSGRQPRAL